MAFFLAQGALVDPRARDGKTPLHIAVEQGWMNAVNVLLGAHAKVNAKDQKGQVSLKRAELFKQDTTAAILRTHGGTD